jgi:membrane-associated protease RseP (regulator of RpoE activity)
MSTTFESSPTPAAAFRSRERRRLATRSACFTAGLFLMMVGFWMCSPRQAPAEPSAQSDDAVASETAAQEVDQAKPLPGAPEAIKPCEFWLGLLVDTIGPNDPLRSHLKLPEKSGVLVREVVPNSPAGNAKLQPGDIVLKAEGKDIAGPRELVQWVETNKDRKASLVVLREGKQITVEITPAKRPATAPAALGELPAGDQPALEAIRRWLEAAPPGAPGYRFHYVHPGVVLPPQVAELGSVPAGMSVTIAKENGKPAKVTVTRNGKKWETTEDRLGDLPPDVRAVVEPMLHRNVFQGMQPGMMPGMQPGMTPPNAGAMPGMPGNMSPMGPVAPELQRQIDELRGQVRDLRKSVDAMRAKAEKPAETAPKK